MQMLRFLYIWGCLGYGYGEPFNCINDISRVAEMVHFSIFIVESCSWDEVDLNTVTQDCKFVVLI